MTGKIAIFPLVELQFNKSFIRKSVLQYRKLLAEDEYHARNAALVQAVISFIDAGSFKNLHVFLAIENNREPDLYQAFDKWWNMGLKIICSKTSFRDQSMSHFYLEKNSHLRKNLLNIPEPVGAREADFQSADLVFVPLLIADRTGHRIGYGGGYYDQLLVKTNGLKVGLSLSSPVDMIIQKDEWDVPMDYLITPYKTYNYG